MSSLSAKGRLFSQNTWEHYLQADQLDIMHRYLKHLEAKPNLFHEVALSGIPVIHSFLVFNINISKKLLTCAKNKKCEHIAFEGIVLIRQLFLLEFVS